MASVPHLHDVNLVRRAVIRTQEHALRRLAYHLSAMDGGREMADVVRPREGTDCDIVRLLRGESGEELISKICDLVLAELGHLPSVLTEDSDGTTQARSLRAVRSLNGGGRTSKASRGLV